MLLALLVASFAAAETYGQASAAEADAFFERKIRPILADRCFRCHGPDKQWAELRLDSASWLRKGGESGLVVVPGKPDESELIRRVVAKDEDLRMPRKSPKLSDQQIEDLVHWVEIGAPWPLSVDQPTVQEIEDRKRQHWAFQPVSRPALPEVKQNDWRNNAIDSFILARLESEGLAPSPATDRRTLIRRATYTLTGLPPTAQEVKDFEQDKSQDAYAKLIERLLKSNRYGEQWGRHWLDVARYSDVKGYVYGREERRFVHSSHYRDWVIKAFNDDLPYERFLLLQLAADQAKKKDPRDLAAMGYLTLGPRFLGVTPDIVDDRIDVVSRGMLGLTVSCARCHDHKYDPIPTADYYSWYGVFVNSSEELVPIPRREGIAPPSAAFTKKLKAFKQDLRNVTAEQRAAASKRVRQKIDHYLLAQRDLENYPASSFSQLLPPHAIFPAIVRRWETYLSHAKERKDPVFLPWLRYAELKDQEFANRSADVTRQLSSQADKINPRIAAAFVEPPVSAADVAKRYQQVFAAVDDKWQTALAEARSAGKPVPHKLPDPHDEALRQVLYDSTSPCVIPDVPIINNEFFWDIGTTKKLWKYHTAVDKHILSAPDAVPHAVVLNDSQEITKPYVFRRGNSTRRGQTVPMRFLKILSGPERQPFAIGSGRLELAQAIADPNNPLTARVWVNRVWMHHFGTGLVSTPSDFGLQSAPPSHPELLDWLASEFIAQGWSTKWLHRTIMQSATYRQSSRKPEDAALADRIDEMDPGNRLLSRMNAHRLTFEKFRDTLLALSGELDPAMGGKGSPMFGQRHSSNRRSVYGVIDREFLPSVLRAYNFANPELHTGKRDQTTVPQQALFAMNGHLLVGQAGEIVKRHGFAKQPLSDKQLRQVYQLVYQRDPSPRELRRAIAFLKPNANNRRIDSDEPETSEWSYGYGEIDSDAKALKSFHLLPYFTGDAWQGGSSWPDAKLGWVRLAAIGGHPGNDHKHAAVRRWTASISGRVSLTSELVHEPSKGNGVRYWVISSRQGVLQTGLVHQSRKRIDIKTIDIMAGDTLEFIVDVYGKLGYDQYLWVPELRQLDSSALANTNRSIVWNAAKDFTAREDAHRSTDQVPRTMWQHFVQALLMSNELLFVD